jgi:hypothetical protein
LTPIKEEDKKDLMLGPEGLSDPDLRPLIWKGNAVWYVGEIMDMVGTWPNNKKKYMQGVKIPVLYGMGEYDFVWKSKREDVEGFAKKFLNAPRVDAASVEGACHALELSRIARGWWTRVLGWTLEVAQSAEGRGQRPKNFDDE